jgi:hypothetical protein
MVKHFACGCGAVHADYCVNCGLSVGGTDHKELSPLDARCEKGAVPHDHPFEKEKGPRMDAYFKGLAARRRSLRRGVTRTARR